MIEVRVPGLLFGTEGRRHDDATGAVSESDGRLQVIKRGESTSETVAEYAPGRWVSWHVLDADALKAEEEVRSAEKAEEHRTRRDEAAARKAEAELKRAQIADREAAAEEVAAAEVGEVELLEVEYAILGPGARVFIGPAGDEQLYEVQELTGYDRWERVSIALDRVDEDADATEADAEVQA